MVRVLFQHPSPSLHTRDRGNVWSVSWHSASTPESWMAVESCLTFFTLVWESDHREEKKNRAKISNEVSRKSLFLLLKSAEDKFLGTLAFTKNVVSGSNFSAAVTTSRNISLQKQRIPHFSAAVIPPYNKSSNQPRKTVLLGIINMFSSTLQWDKGRGKQSSPLACAGEWTEYWVYSRFCTGDQFL